MPNYHNISNHLGYSVKISPISKIRKIFNWGYYSGNKINLKVEFTSIDEEANNVPLSSVFVYLVHPPIGNMEYQENWIAYKNPVIMKSHQVNGMGELSVFLGTKDRIDINVCLLSANVIHPDIVRRDILMIVIGLIGSLFVGLILWLLGFIQIVPLLRMQ